MKHTVIISGGSLNEEFALDFLEKNGWDYLIGADKGIRFLKHKGIVPTHIVGDFDSSTKADLAYFEKVPGIEIRTFNPVKDFTDTEIALRLALELDGDSITILGGCGGSRIDHLIANVRILDIAGRAGRTCALLDEKNRIRLMDKPFVIQKSEQYGKYVSLFAYGAKVEGITLRGFYYLLTNYDMEYSDAVGVSNEITSEMASVSFKNGKLLVVESKD